MKSKKTNDTHYVNNAEFSLAVVEYVSLLNEAKEAGKQAPMVSNYIGECFLKIAKGLSHKANFSGYTYKEEMVMDAVENCLRAIHNYDINASTRSGNPNAFSYFTQICYFAFLRRLAKEKRQKEIKDEFIKKCGIDEFMDYGEDENSHTILENIKNKTEQGYDYDEKVKKMSSEERKKNLELFMD
jgi:DNA-directed RNA polymerase specialized sigma24 family protein